MNDVCPTCKINDLREPLDREYWKAGDPLVCHGCQEEPSDCECCHHCGGARE